MSELGQSPLKCNARDVSAFTPTATEQRTSGDVSNVPNTRRNRLYAKDRPIIAVEVRELNAVAHFHHQHSTPLSTSESNP